MRALSLVRPRGISGLQPVFVGRGRELADLQRAYGLVVTTARPHLVTVAGDAGVGKTRLVGEFWRWLGGDRHRPLLRSGRCLSYGHGITYWPLSEVLKEHFRILDSDPADVVAAGRVAGREGLGLTLGLAPPEGMHPLTVRDRLQTAWVGFLQELTSERPVVVLVEDLHWAGDELCDLLVMLAERVAGPLLLVMTGRPELLDQRPGWAGAGIAGPAGGAAGQRRRSSWSMRCSGSDCPPRYRELVAERAEGNPFFVEELIAHSDRPGRAQPRKRRLVVRSAPAGFLRARHRPGRARRAYRLAAPGREGGAADRRGDRARLLGRPRRRTRAGSGPGLRPARGAGLRAPARSARRSRASGST